MEPSATPNPTPEQTATGNTLPSAHTEPHQVPGSDASNSVTDSFADEDRRDNQLANPGRGEFGAHGPGHTQGGFGNQFRGDEVYGGQVVPAEATRGGYAGGAPENNTGSPESTPTNRSTSTFGTQPGNPEEGSAVAPDYGNDNNAPQHVGGGYSEDYGRSSLGGAGNGGANLTNQRNQTEDEYLPEDSKEEAASPGGFQADPAPVPNQPAVAGANEHTKPDVAREADESRTGYVRTEGEHSEQGNTGTGIGSKGGSYNDPNGPKDDAPGQTGPQNTEPKAQ